MKLTKSMKLTKPLVALMLLATSNSMAVDLTWFDSKTPVSYNIVGKNDPVVNMAANMISDDMKMVTGQKASLSSKGTIQIYQLDKNPGVVRKLRSRNIPVDEVTSRHDGFWIGVRDGRIMVVGRNGRGCAYGILELSRKAGVSPWVWWSDVTPEQKSKLTIDTEFETLQGASVEFRGIFLNDEDWTLSPWAWLHFDPQEKKGLISANAYKQLFKLLMRLRANAVWPGMHGITVAFYNVPGAKEAADSCGIVVGTSHCEPMMRNNVGEWNRKERGEYNYVTNRQAVQDYWKERLVEAGRYQNIYTIGMRGIHDGGMEGVKGEEKVVWLQKVIDDQRKMLSKYVKKDMTAIPQQFVPYKEVLQVFESGLNVPDDVTLTWCDDNFGYMTRLSDAEQQKRKGGAGVYYHLSYWGCPYDYMWLASTQPGLVYNEMREAYRHNARKLWIVNIHEPKVAAYPLELFLDMAWDINAIQPSTINQHLERWLCREFGDQAGRKLAPVMERYYRLTGQRRPEFMGWNKLGVTEFGRDAVPAKDTEFSLKEFGGELDRYLADWRTTRQMLAEAEKLVPQRLNDAFYSHVKYQVLAAAAMSEKTLEAQRARSIARHNYDASLWTRDKALFAACAKSQTAYQEIRSLTKYWNEEMAGGKWRYTMNSMPRDLTVFYAPRLPVALTEKEIAENVGAKPIEPKPMAEVRDGSFVARNACQWTKAGKGVEKVQMLGHSMQAVSLPKGQELTYDFTTEQEGECVLRTAVIPTQPNDKGDIRFSVSVDGAEPTVISFKVPYRSKAWDQNVLRGQSLNMTKLNLKKGSHTLVIKALDNHVLIDQWMIDFKPDRKFYLIPAE